MSGEARAQRRDRDREERRAGNDMGWAKRLIEYALVILVAIIVAILIIWYLMPKDSGDYGGGPSVPQLRAECDRQFGAGGVRAEQLNANEEGEFLLAYREPLASPDTTSSDGFSSATSPTTTQSSRVRGFVIVRVQPQFPYDYSGGQNSSSFGSADTSNVRPETTWDEVTVTVARYINPLRNERVCGEGSMQLRFREGKFETYCDIPMRFTPEDGGQATIRLFVSNRSSVPIEYCIVSNCDASAPWGSGQTCQLEQQQVQALQ